MDANICSKTTVTINTCPYYQEVGGAGAPTSVSSLRLTITRFLVPRLVRLDSSLRYMGMAVFATIIFD
jgi:hypothetical protein